MFSIDRMFSIAGMCSLKIECVLFSQIECAADVDLSVREASKHIRSMKTAVNRAHSAHLPKVVRALSQWYFPKP